MKGKFESDTFVVRLWTKESSRNPIEVPQDFFNPDRVSKDLWGVFKGTLKDLHGICEAKLDGSSRLALVG